MRMEFCNYHSLQYWLSEGKEGPLMEEINGWILIYQICLGLAHLYEKGIIHRDIKPANVVLTVDRFLNVVQAKIADFGVSTVDKSALTGRVGTPGYRSPEVVSEIINIFSRN